jgi:hypothetical protein
LNESEKSVSDTTQAMATTKAFMQITTRGVQHAADANACVLCQRAFAGAERERFIAEQREKETTLLPAMLKDNEAALKRASDAVAALQRARPLWDDCKRLSEHAIPQAEEALRTCVTLHHAPCVQRSARKGLYMRRAR